MTARRRTRGQNEGSIYKRASDGRWVGSVSLGRAGGVRQRKTVYGHTRAEVSAKLDALRQQQREGRVVKPERRTVAELLERWHAEVVVPNRRPSTVAAYRTAIDAYLVPAVGDKAVSSLSAADVQSLLARMRRGGLSGQTARQAHAVLRMALDQAVLLDLAPRNVAALVDRPRADPHEPNPLSPDEARRLLEHVAAHRLAALYEISIRLGLRQAEALGLRWRDVDAAAGVLHVRHQLRWVDRAPRLAPPKTERGRRTLDVTPPLLTALEAHRARQDDEPPAADPQWRDLLFLGERTRGPMRHSTPTAHLKAALAATGMEERCWHDLRHTFATLGLAAGVPERVLMEMLGHARMDMLTVYAHVLPSTRRQAAGRLDALLGGARDADGYTGVLQNGSRQEYMPQKTAKRRAKTAVKRRARGST